MAAAFVGGAALGAAFGELLKAVLDVKDRAVKFKSILNDLASTLSAIEPMFTEIAKLDRVLDRPRRETEMFTHRLKDAKKLVQKCSKIKCWNYYKKPYFAKKLMDLKESLLNFFQIEVPALNCVYNRQILVGINSLDGKLDRIGSSLTLSGQVSDLRICSGLCGVPEVPDFIIGLDVPLQLLKMQLLKEGVSVVVLSAPGGCGKTTLAKMLCHDNEIKGIFGDIFFLTVSQKPNLKVLIQKLFQHKGYYMAPEEFQSDDEAINQLGFFLREIAANPFLLVLDDVWSGSESLIHNFVSNRPGCKILVTSRSVFPRFDSTYELKLLNDNDSMALFRNAACLEDGSCNVPDDFVNEIVKGCKGSPLVLKVVGRSLCRQPVSNWRSTLMEWSKGQSIFSSNNELLTRLQTSLDALDEGLKECYLDLGSFPEDQRIPVTALIDMWVELYNLDEDGVQTLANLHKLSDRSLVSLVFARKDASEVDDYYNDHFVLQHDLLRELAIHQSRNRPVELGQRLIMDIRANDLPKWPSEQMQQPIHARLLSISTDETFSSSWYNMQLPEVEVLILNFQARNYILPKFMEKMNKLKVLIIINYDFCLAEISNFPLLHSLSAIKRIRLEHVSIVSLSISTLELRKLRKISLVMCEIGEAFRNFTTQSPNTLPNLMEIDIDCCNDLVEFPVGLCDIVRLKKLSITNCHELDALPEEFGKLANLEVLRLQNCTKLSVLPESIGSLHKLSFLDISGCLGVTKLPVQMGELCGLRRLNMRGCSGLSELPSSVKDLGLLKDVICDEEALRLWEPYKIHLSKLKIKVIREDINLSWLLNLPH